MTRQPFDRNTNINRRHSESGSVVTAMIAAVSLVGLLGVATYNLMSGPFSTMARLNNETVTKVDMMAASRILIMNSVSGAGGGDCDADGNIEPVAWRTGNGPTNGGLIPDTIGAPVTDAWGTDYGYCVWDLGTASDDVACGGPGLNRLDGTDDPLAGETPSQTVLALVSAGPDRQFSTTCVDYVDATTPLISSTAGTDDIIMPYAYAEASQATSALWTIKSGDDTTITIDKNIEIGTNVSMDKTTGLASFMGVHASGRLSSAQGIQVGNETNGAVCDANNVGVIRFNRLSAELGSQEPIVIEQKAKGYLPWAADNSTPVEVTLPNPPTTGNTIIVLIHGVTDSSNGYDYLTMIDGGVTDNEGNTYKLVHESTNRLKAGTGFTGYDGHSYIFVADNISSYGTSFTVSALPSSTPDYEANITVIEVSGLNPAGSFDIAKDIHKGELTTGFPSGTTTSIDAGSNNADNSLILANFIQVGNADAMSVTPEAGFTTLYNTDTDTSGKIYVLAYQAQPTAGNVSTTWTHNDVSAGYRWGTLFTLASFKGGHDTVTSGEPGLEVCNGENWVGTGYNGVSGGLISGGGHWDRTGTDIYYDKNISINTSNNATNQIMNMVSNTGQDMQFRLLNDNCGAGCFAEFGIARAQGLAPGLESGVIDGDVISAVNFYGYANSDFREAADISVTSDGGGNYSKVRLRAMDTAGNLNTGLVVTGDNKFGFGKAFNGSVEPSAKAHIKDEQAIIMMEAHNNTDNVPQIRISRSRKNADESNTTINTGDSYGSIDFTGKDTDSYETFARLEVVKAFYGAQVDYTPIDFVISTGNQTSNLTERMRFSYQSHSNLGTGVMGIHNSSPDVAIDIAGPLMLGNGSETPNFAQPEVSGKATRLLITPYSFFCCTLDYSSYASAWSPANTSKYNVAIGRNNTGNINDDPSLLIGRVNKTDIVSGAILIGNTNEGSDMGLAIGEYNTANGVSSVAIGRNADAFAAYSYCIGNDVICLDENTFAFGNNTTVGDGSNTAQHAMAIGLNSSTITTNTTPNYMLIDGGNWGVNAMNPAYTLDVNGTAGSSSSTNWTNASDVRLKDLHGPYTKGLSDIMRLKPTVFNYKRGNPLGLDPSITHRGFIAQEVQDIFPDAISTRPDGYLDFDMHNISIAMINAAKELKQANDNLAESNAALRDKNKQTKQALKNIQMRVAHLREKLNEPHGNKLPFNGWLLLLGVLAAGTTASVIAIRGKRHDK